MDDELNNLDLCPECCSLHLNDFLSMDTYASVNLPFASCVGPPLHVLVKHGHLNAVKFLQEKYVDLDINKVDYFGMTPLHLALDCGRIGVASFLLSLDNCDVNRKTNKSAKLNGFDVLDAGSSVLHMAIQTKHNIEAGCLEWDGATAADYLQFIKQLCGKKADCNSKTSQGRTPVHYAVMYGDQEDVVETLAKQDADLEIYDDKQHTPLLCTVAYSKPKSLKILLEYGAKAYAKMRDQNALHMLFDKELDDSINYDIAKLLINSGCPVYEPDGFGDTILHIAVGNENLNAVKFLLSNSAKTTVLCQSTPTQIQDAFENEYPEMANLLRERLGERGDLQDVPESQNYTPFHQVMFIDDENKIKEFCDAFLSAGVSVNTYTQNGKTVLMLAVAQQKIQTSKYLLSIGADVNLTDSKGWNVLHIASKKFEEGKLQVEFYGELLRLSGDINSATNRKCTALHITSENRKPLLSSMLIKAGASLHLLDDQSDRPLDSAIINKDIESCVLFLKAGDFIEKEMTEIYETELKYMEEKLMLKENKKALYVFLSSGYKFNIESLLENLDLYGDTSLQNAEMVLNSAQSPLPLKRQSANVVLRKLAPNGWAGVDCLDFPPGGKDLLRSYIILENVS